MKISPLKISDPWFGRVQADSQVQVESLRAVPVENNVEVELVELLHGSAEENYRPYLHLRGELTEAIPEVELPYGITELVLRRGSGLRVDAFYDFNAPQLSDLVSKGYFTSSFKVPDDMSGIPWTLPGKADFTIVAPEFEDQPPLVFMALHDQSELALDETNSGYDLAEYFPDYSTQTEPTVALSGTEAEAAPERTGSGRDMFSDDVLEAPRAAAPIRYLEEVADEDRPRTAVPDGIFRRLIDEIEARTPAPEATAAVDEQAEAEPAIEPGSPVDVYLSRVAPGVEQALSGAAAETAAETPAEQVLGAGEPTTADPHSASEGGFLHVPDEEEVDLAPAPVSIGESTTDAHLAAASRRAARIRSELAQDDEAEAAATRVTQSEQDL